MIYLQLDAWEQGLADFEAALGDCDEALEVNPREVVAVNLRGAIRLKLGD